MLSREEYKEFYKNHHRCPDSGTITKYKLNDKQLDSRYDKYVKKQKHIREKSKFRLDEDWIALKSQLVQECALIRALRNANRITDINSIYRNGTFLVKSLDGAHVISRQKAPFMKYDPDNVVMLNRYSHSQLDFMRSPIDGTPITKDEQDGWWKFILGEERWERLNEKYRQGVAHGNNHLLDQDCGQSESD